MSQNKHTGITAFCVALICLMAVALSLTVGVDHHEVQQRPLSIHEAEKAEQPMAFADQLPDEQMRTYMPDIHINLMVSPEIRREMLRRERLQDALQIRDALELQRQMHEELNKRYRLQ